MQPAQRNRVLLFLLVAGVAALFAIRTNHVWEDYYITYRSSKNLATGHGLVYNHGDRLHTFTSPLGVLLPAVASLLTLNSSDPAALWIFRLMSCCALGGAALLLAHAAQARDHARLAAVLLIGWLALDAKIVDFAINGMETAFLVLFLAYALWAHLVPRERAWLHLGCAWAGLMWTRPDSFIYIGLLAGGFWLFHEPDRTGATRGQLLRTFLQAGLATTALYLPWFLFAWGYYGTPIPHTITAKSGIGDPRTLAGLGKAVVHLPFSAWNSNSSTEATFLPAYYMLGGWPDQLIQIARGLAATCTLLWLLPFLRVETRAASFAFFGAHAYLSYFPYFPFPWYLPSTTLLAIFCLSSLLAQILAAADSWASAHRDNPRPRQIVAFFALLVGLALVGNGWMTWQTARLMAAQQRLVEDGTRRKIGEWLQAHARPDDTVFMEPLGYIGFFSGLKTYDFPGLSSREMVEARKKVGVSWTRLINELKPRWLVLRPQEVNGITGEDFDLLSTDYAPTREFSAANELAGLDIPGRPYLEFDSRFTVYRRVPESERLKPAVDTSPFPINRIIVDDVSVSFAHAPSTLVRPVPAGARHGRVQFGFVPGAYAGPDDRTDGAIFKVELASGDRTVVLATRTLDPAALPDDRGLQTFNFDLPAHPESARILLEIDAGKSTSKDWTFWGDVEFR